MIEFYEEKNGFCDYQKVWDIEIRAYTFKELHAPKVEAVIAKAKDMYATACADYNKKHGDMGTCVLGNGIYIGVKPPRKRNTYRMQLCVPRGQSDSASSACKDPVLAYLKENGLECWYECGRMD